MLPQVELVVDSTAWAPDVFPYPRQTWSVTVIHKGTVIGSLHGIHSKNECLYVLFVEIHPAHRRQHFGLAVLSALYQCHHLPLVPVGVLDAAQSFWGTALQRLATQGIILGTPLSRYDAFDAGLVTADSQPFVHVITDDQASVPHHRRPINQQALSSEATCSIGVGTPTASDCKPTSTPG